MRRDSAGNLYGAGATGGAFGLGYVFKLSFVGSTWVFTDLHDFSGAEGNYPLGGVTLDANGNIFGTTYYGGSQGQGVVYEITP